MTIWVFLILERIYRYSIVRVTKSVKCLLRKGFDLLRNSPLSSIHIHFGVELLVFGPFVTSGSLSKNKFFDRLHKSRGLRPCFCCFEW